MTSGRVSGGPSRGADAPTRTTWTRDGIGAIVAVLALGLVFRLIILQLNPGSGFGVDLASFQVLGRATSRARASHGFYDRALLPRLHARLPLRPVRSSAWSATSSGGIGDLIKIPPILADVGARLARLVDGPRARRRAGGRR